jgi:L-lactate dehydrogenase
VLDGEYGVSDVAIGVPAVLTQSGVQQIIELQLEADEVAKFNHSVSVIKANIACRNRPAYRRRGNEHAVC